MIRYLELLTAGLLALIIVTQDARDAVASDSASTGNMIARYLDGAELQAETDGQRREIARALQDILNIPVAELRKQRYSDYAGEATAWTVTDLLRAYFVPRQPMSVDPERFYREVGQPQAKAAVRKQLKRIQRALADSK